MQQLTNKPRSRSLIEAILVFIVALYAFVLLIGPIAAIVWHAFSFGVRSLGQLFSADALSAFELTLVISAAALAINTFFGICISVVLVRHDFRGRAILNALVDLPFAVSPVIVGFMLVLLFGNNGWLASLANMLGLKIVFALPAMILVTTFVSLPFVIREVMPVLEQVGTTQELAARTMGASSWQTFWHVTVPSIRWGLLHGVSLTWARAIGEFGAVLVVSGSVSRSTESATLFIFRSLDDRNYVGAYAMSLILVLISLAVLGGMQFVKRRVEAS